MKDHTSGEYIPADWSNKFLKVSKKPLDPIEQALQAQELEKAKTTITQLESQVLVLTEALTLIAKLTRPTPPETVGILESKSVSPTAAYRIGKYNAAVIAQQALSTTPAAEIRDRIRAEGFNEGVEACVEDTNKTILGWAGVPSAKQALHENKSRLQSIKNEVGHG